MLKRSGALLLSMLYMVTIFGFALDLHYCGSFLVSVKINSPAKSCTGISSGKMKCCKNKQIEVKVTDAHRGVSSDVLAKRFAFEMLVIPLSSHFLYGQQVFLEKALNNVPPDIWLSRTPSFVKNCTFRI